jgi:hypothetical protein
MTTKNYCPKCQHCLKNISKNYCSKCQHCLNKWGDTENISMVTADTCSKCEHCKKILIFDYCCCRIANSNVNNNTVCHLNKILSLIKKTTDKFVNYQSLIKINFADNYLRDDAIKELVQFIQDNHLKQLSKLNLRGNRLTLMSSDNIKFLFSYCPQIKINLSINRISNQDCIKQFGDLINRIKCNNY